MDKTKKSSFVTGAAILGIAGLLVKIIGAVYRIPLTNIVGSDGMAYYEVAYPYYSWLLYFLGINAVCNTEVTVYAKAVAWH